MSRVRAIDGLGDWEYGKGQNDYKTQRDAVAQNIQTRLSSFLGDCFFDLGAGVDWFNFLGSKDELALNLAINAIILNTQNVESIIQTFLSLTTERRFTVKYIVNTSFGVVASQTEPPVIPTSYLTTEDGDPLTTEDGDNIII